MIDLIVERLRAVISFAAVTLLNPSWNPRAAWALYALIVTFALLVAVIITVIAMDVSQRRRSRQQAFAEPDTSEPAPAGAPVARRVPRTAKPMSRRARWLLGGGVLVALAIVWVTAGFTTSRADTCKGCHWPASAHAAAEQGGDPHASVPCVSCHETGGVIGRYITGVPLRLLHIVAGSGEASASVGYVRVPAKACAGCHADALAATTTNSARGLKMSHKEPAEASATCTDCHALRGGIVGVHNVGMSPCLRCHDGKKASAACATCHTQTASAAARARTTSFRAAQIKQVNCGGCHDEKRQCDPCHGMRMPHSADFMSHTHARAAAVDYWYNGGKVCRRCHTDTRRSCRCHTKSIGVAHGSPSGLAVVHRKADSVSCNSCHGKYATIVTRDFCRDVCHSPEAIAASPR